MKGKPYSWHFRRAATVPCDCPRFDEANEEDVEDFLLEVERDIVEMENRELQGLTNATVPTQKPKQTA